PNSAATLVRDSTTAGVGSASARINLPAAGPATWWTSFASVGSINLSPGQSYSATFWAKASTPMTFPIVAARASDAYAFDFLNLAVGTTWKHYQVVFAPNAFGAAQLQFWLGLVAGQVWFDDVHFQAG